ncbi:hypothetical protein [Companilactobacillus halodurans]|nr:hypothetical protein [Companilactobacillus halodurans]
MKKGKNIKASDLKDDLEIIFYIVGSIIGLIVLIGQWTHHTD